METTPRSEPEAGIRIDITDLATGQTESRVIWNDFTIVCAGDRYLDNVQAYGTGTQVLTVKRRKDV